MKLNNGSASNVDNLGKISHKHNLHGNTDFSQFFDQLKIQSEDGKFWAWIDQDDIPKLEQIIQKFKERIGLQHFPKTTLHSGSKID